MRTQNYDFGNKEIGDFFFFCNEAEELKKQLSKNFRTARFFLKKKRTKKIG